MVRLVLIQSCGLLLVNKHIFFYQFLILANAASHSHLPQACGEYPRHEDSGYELDVAENVHHVERHQLVLLGDLSRPQRVTFGVVGKSHQPGVEIEQKHQHQSCGVFRLKSEIEKRNKKTYESNIVISPASQAEISAVFSWRKNNNFLQSNKLRKHLIISRKQIAGQCGRVGKKAVRARVYE